MNAGRGRAFNQSIGDYVESVEILRNGKIITVPKEDCGFAYRTSIFKNTNDVILVANLHFPYQSFEESERKIKERIELCREKQDNSAPNFGSVFSLSDDRIMAYVKKRGLGKKNYATFSKKTNNWILRAESGKFDDVLKVIKKVETIHRIFGKQCQREVIVWE